MSATQLTGTLGSVTLMGDEGEVTGLLIDAALAAGVLVLDRDVEWYAEAGCNVTVTLAGAVIAHERFETEAQREAWIEGEGLELALEAHVRWGGVEDAAAAA